MILRTTGALLACAAVLGAQAAGKRAFEPLPLGSVKPRGWLLQQLNTQASGLSGHLHDFWPDVGPNSGWLGGTGESWERGPYYIDGLVPLAYQTGDPKLLGIVKKFIEWTITNQRPDGAIGPVKNTDWWPNMVMLKALTQYQEATGDQRVVPLMQRYFKYHAANADARPLRQWASFRWQDEVYSILWLHKRAPEPWLLDLARKLKSQGYDWMTHYAKLPYTTKGQKGNTDLKTHIVNNAQGLKSGAIWYLVTGIESDRAAAQRTMDLIERYHMLPNGLISGDEHLAGLSPSQGTELCAVVEGMFSFENMISATGDTQFGDRLEKYAYNGLPGTFDGKMWAHQYDQQPNQVLCDIYPRDWTTNRPDSNLFGLEPNFGCCTANFHQGWPKLVSHLWMGTPAGGVAAIAYGPNQLSTKIRDVAVSIDQDTEYPFRGSVRLTVNPASPLEFPLQLRIPGWAEGAKLTINGRDAGAVKPGTFATLTQRWKKGDRVELMLPMKLRASRWYNDSIAIERGPLVFSLPVGEEWIRLKEYKFESADWEIRPTTPWNYALRVNPADVEKSLKVEERPVGNQPWTPAGAPVVITATASRVPSWKMLNGSAAPVPQSPVATEDNLEKVTLIPYGSAKLRVTALPLAEPK